MRNVILQGDALETLKTLPDNYVQCVVTSPPYYGLRDYGHEGQIGLEESPQDYVKKLQAVFREVKRILRTDGVLWLNLGDSYASGGSKRTGRNDENEKDLARRASQYRTGQMKAIETPQDRTVISQFDDRAPKNLLGIPWRVAFALQDDGWILRSDVIWEKPSAMPESVKDRPTKAHEYVFML